MSIVNPRLIGLPAVALALACAVSPALAQTADPARSPPERPGIERAIKDLGLTEAQQQQMRSLRESHRQATEGLRQQMKASLQTLKSTPTTDPNYASITAAARQNLQNARSQLRTQQDLLQTNMRNLLTAEQANKMELARAALHERIAARKAEGKTRGNGRFGRPPGG